MGAKIIIDTALNSTGFKAGLDSMRQEAGRFRQTFSDSLDKGGGLFGSLDKAAGKLASGPLARMAAGIGAAMVVAGKAVSMVEAHFDNLNTGIARTKSEMEGMAGIYQKVAAQRFQGGAANTILESEVKDKEWRAKDAESQADKLGDPTTLSGAIKTYRNRGHSAATSALMGFRTFSDSDNSQADALKLYNEKKDAASKARQEAAEANQMYRFQRFGNSMTQFNAEQGYEGKTDQARVKSGGMADFEAQEKEVYRAKKRFDATSKMYGDSDPRTIASRGEMVDATSSFQQMVEGRGRNRNDAVISADSLSRLGGGGGVNAFGDGKGELLSETKRVTAAIERVVKAIEGQKMNPTTGTFDIN